MPFTVQDLIVDRPEPVTVSRDESAEAALRRMIEFDYSQLPVVDREGRAEGMITSDSIIRALNHFDLTIKEMRVFHAMTDVDTYGPEEDLFGLLDDLKDAYAVAVVDNDKRVIGIVTSYDTTEYFRRRGEDMMLIEDIETMLKEYVLAAFQNGSGDPDRAALDAAVEEISETNSKLRGPFGQALHQYLQAEPGTPLQVDNQRAEKVFAQHLNPKQPPKPFERLSLGDYIKLFLSKGRWAKYKVVFDLDPDSCHKLLGAVNDIRNELAHFRAEITPHKREQLRFCKEWLARHQDEVAKTFAPPAAEVAPPTTIEGGGDGDASPGAKGVKALGDFLTDMLTAIRLGKFDGDDLPVQLAESDDSRASRYAPLANYLQSIPPDEDKAEMTFKDIELFIGGRLPRYAREHRSWWANDSIGHVQSQQWLWAGWRVSAVNMPGERVTFTRIKEREQAYIEFYSKLLSDLRGLGGIPVRTNSADGSSWVVITRLAPEGEAQLSIVGFSFARGGRFRVELYIDQGNGEANKRIFDDLLKRREEIESEIGEELSWERLDQRRASRIAVYRPGSITDDAERLAELRSWGAATIVKFYRVFKPLISLSTNNGAATAEAREETERSSGQAG
jgi:CBS domain-containing protein